MLCLCFCVCARVCECMQGADVEVQLALVELSDESIRGHPIQTVEKGRIDPDSGVSSHGDSFPKEKKEKKSTGGATAPPEIFDMF